MTGAALLFVCISAFLSLVLGTRVVGDKPFRAGGYAGEWLASVLSGYFNRTGSVIVVLTLIFLSIIMSTQFSFGRLFRAVLNGLGATGVATWRSFREWQEERRRQQQRREVIAKHTKKGALPPEIKIPSPPETASGLRSEPPKPLRKREDEAAMIAAPGVSASRPSRRSRRRSPCRRRRCPCRIPSRPRKRRPSGGRASTRCRPRPCSTRRKPSGRSTSAS